MSHPHPKMLNMLIGPAIIAFLLPIQIYANDLQHYRPETDLYVRIARDTAVLIGLPNLMNRFPVINHDQELILREATKYDRPPKRRKLFILKFLRSTNTFSNT
jgi:hypothetical protein